MGVLRKNEQYNDQMVDICQFLHKFVPKHDDNEEQSLLKPVKVLSGGDYLPSSDINLHNQVWQMVGHPVAA